MSAAPARRFDGAAWLALALLLAVAAALRWVAWLRTVAIFNDGPRFLAQAQAMEAGDWRTAFAEAYHPLYALATLAVHRLGPDWETAGAVVSIAGGTAAVGFLFLFLRETFGSPVDWLGAGLLAVQSRAIEFASDVQSDGLYLGLFAAALWASWRALASRSSRVAVGAGLLAGLAYWTRPEGLGVALATAGVGVLHCARGHWPRTEWRWVAALALGAVLLTAPYVVLLHAETGEWRLTSKKSVSQLVGAPTGAVAPTPARSVPPQASPTRRPGSVAPPALPDPPPPAAGERGWWEAARELVGHARSTSRYAVILLVPLGLWISRGWPGERGLFLLSLVAIYGAVLFALTLNAGYVSRRHVLPFLMLLFGYAGIGAVAGGELLGRGWQRATGGRGEVRPVVAATCGALLIAGLTLHRQAEPKRSDQWAERRAAEWLRIHAPEGGRVAGERRRVGYYAGMPYVSLRGVSSQGLGPHLERLHVRYVVVDEPARARMLRELAERGAPWELLHHLDTQRGEAWVFGRRSTSPARSGRRPPER
ncbi:MAG: glycosyltransferase family 39 protein [Myxococcota bacterium]|nr:glycosyltransferase family 39 protein [Myxococcota bacterium]